MNKRYLIGGIFSYVAAMIAIGSCNSNETGSSGSASSDRLGIAGAAFGVELVRSSKNTVTDSAHKVLVVRNGVRSRGLKPGDTVVLSGNYLYIQLKGIKGTVDSPIVFTNRGLVTVGGVSAYTMIMTGSHFKILGNGDPAHKYGLKIGSKVATTVLQLAGSSETEVAFVEVDKGAIGIQANLSTGGPVFNNHWHHNYLHNLGDTSRSEGRSEAFYIGYTKGASTAVQNNCRIEDNLIEDITGDAIQVNYGTFSIKRNIIRNWATAALPSQRSGIVLGGSVDAVVEFNTLENSTAKVMEIFADRAIVKDNVFKNIDMRSNSSEDLVYVNSKLIGEGKVMTIDFQNNRFINTIPNRKFVTVQAGPRYGLGRWIFNEGLSRENISIPKGDLFEPVPVRVGDPLPPAGKTVKKRLIIYDDYSIETEAL